MFSATTSWISRIVESKDIVKEKDTIPRLETSLTVTGINTDSVSVTSVSGRTTLIV